MLELLDRVGSSSASRVSAAAVLPSTSSYCVGTLRIEISRLNHTACTCPYRRLAPVLTDDHPRLGVEVVRYSFLVRLFHS